jgi:hypothetical protein
MGGFESISISIPARLISSRRASCAHTPTSPPYPDIIELHEDAEAALQRAENPRRKRMTVKVDFHRTPVPLVARACSADLIDSLSKMDQGRIGVKSSSAEQPEHGNRAEKPYFREIELPGGGGIFQFLGCLISRPQIVHGHFRGLLFWHGCPAVNVGCLENSTLDTGVQFAPKAATLRHFQVEKALDFLLLCRVQIPLGIPYLFPRHAGSDQRVCQHQPGFDGFSSLAIAVAITSPWPKHAEQTNRFQAASHEGCVLSIAPAHTKRGHPELRI